MIIELTLFIIVYMASKYTVWLPVEITRESFRAGLIKADKLEYASNEILLDKMLFMAAEIHRVSLNNYFLNEDGIELTHLYSKYIKENLKRSGGVTYKEVLDCLFIVDAIDGNSSYFPANYSKSYGLKYRGKKFTEHAIELKYWQPSPRKLPFKKTDEVSNLIEAIKSNISKVQIDKTYLKKVIANETSLLKILYYGYSMNALMAKKVGGIYAKADDFGRIHHNITNISKTLRPALTVGGESIYSVDLSASQLFFSIKGVVGYAKQKKNTSDWKVIEQKLPDVQKFIDAVLNGKFYTSINQHLQFSAEDLKVNKVKTLMPIFSQKDPKRKTKYYKALETIFPTFLNFVNSKKKENHADAAKFLQTEESSVMIGKVCSRLMSEGFWFLPVHDCILTTINNVDRVKAIIIEECQIYNGFNPHMKVSDWTGAKLELPLFRTPEEDKSFRLKNILDFTVDEKRRKRDKQRKYFADKTKTNKTKKVKK